MKKIIKLFNIQKRQRIQLTIQSFYCNFYHYFARYFFLNSNSNLFLYSCLFVLLNTNLSFARTVDPFDRSQEPAMITPKYNPIESGHEANLFTDEKLYTTLQLNSNSNKVRVSLLSENEVISTFRYLKSLFSDYLQKEENQIKCVYTTHFAGLLFEQIKKFKNSPFQKNLILGKTFFQILSNINSTDYIQIKTEKYNYKWDFHIAPIIAMKKNNQIYIIVLDPFFDQPMPIKEWETVLKNNLTTKNTQYKLFITNRYYFSFDLSQIFQTKYNEKDIESTKEAMKDFRHINLIR